MDWDAVAEEAVRDHHALQKPDELAALLAFVDGDVHPRLVVELGSDAGGTLWAWGQLGCDVVSVSAPQAGFSTARPLVAHGAHVIEGDTHDLATWVALGVHLRGRRADVLFVDADHTREGAGADVMAYTRYLASGGLVVLHDICVHPRRPQVAVHEVWAALTDVAVDRWEFVAEPSTWGGIGVTVLG